MSIKDFYTKGNKEYDQYIHSPEWKKISVERMKIDNHTCCVCGKPATEVHHLTYDNFKHERSEDLVSLCHRCHEQAEKFYSMPWVEKGDNFMVAMREDAQNIAPLVYDYIKEVRGFDFESLMELRQPIGKQRQPIGEAKGKTEGRTPGAKYWEVLERAVDALCRKRYSYNYAEDRRSMALGAITNRVEEICLAEIEHCIRNYVQKDLHDAVTDLHDIFGKWTLVATALGIKMSTLTRIKNDNGINAGPSMRQTAFYYCGADACAGIHPDKGFSCLSDKDYQMLNDIADYALGLDEDVPEFISTLKNEDKSSEKSMIELTGDVATISNNAPGSNVAPGSKTANI